MINNYLSKMDYLTEETILTDANRKINEPRQHHPSQI